MAHKQEWAKRLLRELPKKGPEALLRSRSYADPTFLPLFFEYLDDLIFHDPKKGLEWARRAPDLAQKVAAAEAGGEGRQEHQERLVRAWAILGGALRACGDRDSADVSFGKAFALIEAEAVSELVRADVDRRFSYLRACQDRPEEALELAAGAVCTFRESGTSGKDLARALISKGYVLVTELGQPSEAVEAFGEALSLAGDSKATPAGKRLHGSACHNLAYAIISRSATLRDQSKAMFYIKQAREMVKGQRRSVGRYRLLWCEGLVCSRTGGHARAEKAFRVALEGFEALELPWEIALVGLDLGVLLQLFGEWAELRKLAEETYHRFCLLSADTEAIAALSQWVAAVRAQTLDEELVGKTRRIIAARVFTGHRRARNVT